MSKQDPKDPNFQEKIPELKKSEKNIDLVIIKTDSNSPIQEVMCKKEHKKIFMDLYEGKKWL